MCQPRSPAERVAFTTSRLMEYFTEKDLQAQIGHPRGLWLPALLKELVDNALDACEAGGVAPAIQVLIGDDFLSVEDNGPGIPPEVVAAVADFSTRTSSNSRYVSPTRGQQGNALKCVMAAPAVLFPGEDAGLAIEARGLRHRLLVRVDPIAQEPRIEHRQESVVRSGTLVRLDWPGIASCLDNLRSAEFYNAHPADLLSAFATFNPHAEFRLNGSLLLEPAPTQKWNACERTSAHWYGVEQFRDLIAAHLHREQQGLAAPRFVRELVSQFDGLSGSAKVKQVVDACGLSGKKLADLVGADGIDLKAIVALLGSMKQVARPIRPKALGRVGKANWCWSMEVLDQAKPDSLRYRASEGEAGGRPFVVEAALAIRERECLWVNVGLNWSPTITRPFAWLDNLLAEELLIGVEDPVGINLHVVTPLVAFNDRGKSRAALPPEIQSAAAEALRAVGRAFAQEKQKTERKARLAEAALSRLERAAERPEVSLKEAAWQVMVRAHEHVTGGTAGAPAQARQIMYAARKLMQAIVGPRCWKDSATFTQHYLPDFIAEHPEVTADWNVVYDDRGELIEPHGGRAVGLGTLNVRAYLAAWAPHRVVGGPREPSEAGPGLGRPADLVEIRNNGVGPASRYGAVLLVEKEGFRHLLEQSQIADRFGVALAWTKGLSTTACRELVDHLSGRGVTTYVLHDFDKNGLSIVHTLCHDGRRYRFKNKPLVVDVGLRLADVQELGLDGEDVVYRQHKKSPAERLAEYGATEDECAYMVREKTGPKTYQGRRVELNEMNNQQFIGFLERKLTEAGVGKVTPPEETLRDAYLAAWRRAQVEHAVEQAVTRVRAEAEAEAYRQFGQAVPEFPESLLARITESVRGRPLSWDESLASLVRQSLGGA